MVVQVVVEVGFSELGCDVVSPVQSFELLICFDRDFVLDHVELLEYLVVAGRVRILFKSDVVVEVAKKAARLGDIKFPN